MYRYPVLCVGLAACVSAGGEFASSDTGLTGQYSRQVVVSDHPHHVLYGHMVRLSDGESEVLALVISHRRDGVHRLRFSQARLPSGRPLPFRRLDPRLGCSHGHCRNDAIGFIALTEAMVAEAGRAGFRALLVGPSGSIPLAVPPAPFAAVAQH